ncbi:MAG: hypothetical protein LBC51_11520 [Treponema sp.]|nr:hypothetical protein [Treponema sp.]
MHKTVFRFRVMELPGKDKIIGDKPKTLRKGVQTTATQEAGTLRFLTTLASLGP